MFSRPSFSRPSSTRLSIHSALLGLALSMVSCNSTSMIPDGSKYVQPLTMNVPPENQRKLSFRLDNLANRPEFDDISSRFAALAEKKQYVVQPTALDADLIYVMTVRYFGVNPAKDDGESVIKGDPEIRGGDSGWTIPPGGNPAPIEKSKATPIATPTNSGGGMFAEDEWVCVIDVVVGARTSQGGKDYSRYEARLLAWVRQPNLTAETAATALARQINDTALSQLLK